MHAARLALRWHGGELAGFFLVRGTRQQIDDARNDPDFRRRVARGGMFVDGLGVVTATVGEGLQQVTSMYQDVIGELT